MELGMTLQLFRPMKMAWEQPFASLQQKEDISRSSLGNSGARRGRVSHCGRKDVDHKLGFAAPNYSNRGHERISRLATMPCGSTSSKNRGKAKRKMKALAYSAVNEVGQRSSNESGHVSSEDELKDQLEALQEEALQVRDRYNGARARFMRLTEVAQQLRQRASIDINLGNEDGARKVLLEKQKVIRAAEISKERAQLLERLSAKLGEAISRKETQLIVALSSPRLKVSLDKEPTVRVVSPKGEASAMVDLGLHREENPSSTETAEAPVIAHEVPVSEDMDQVEALVKKREDVEGGSKQVTSDSGDVTVEEEKVIGANAQRDSIVEDQYDKEEEVKATGAKLDLDNENRPDGEKEVAGDGRDIDVQSRGSLLVEDCMQGAALTSGLDRVAEETSFGSGLADTPSDVLVKKREDVEGGSKQVTSDSGDVTVEDKVIGANGQRDSIVEDQYDEEEEVEVTGAKLDLDNENRPDGEKEVAGDSRDVEVQSGGSLLFDDCIQGAALTSSLDRVAEDTSSGSGIADAPSGPFEFDGIKSLNDSAEKEEVDEASRDDGSESGNSTATVEEVGGASQDFGLDKVDLFGRKEAVGSTGKVTLYDGGSLSFADCMLDVDDQVATVESKLQRFMVTAGNSNKDTDRLQLVGEFLEQVQSLRARISALVRELPQEEVQNSVYTRSTENESTFREQKLTNHAAKDPKADFNI